MGHRASTVFSITATRGHGCSEWRVHMLIAQNKVTLRLVKYFIEHIQINKCDFFWPFHWSWMKHHELPGGAGPCHNVQGPVRSPSQPIFILNGF